jgi:HK97 family phage major capsid protein
MNKRMRELLALIETKTKEARSCMDGENKDVAKAKALLDEADQLKAEYEAEQRLYEAEKQEAEQNPEAGEAAKSTTKASYADIVKAFAADVRNGFKTNNVARLIRKEGELDGVMTEGVPADGGYTVPEDISTKIEELRDSEFSLLRLVRVEKVKTKTGARTFKKRAQQTGFQEVAEGGKIGKVAAPKFERLAWAIKKYAGYLPITNELRYDSDANIVQVVINWLAGESRVTANKLILAKIATKAAVDLKGLDGIKKAINVTLGSAFAGLITIVTNDDGLQYLDTLKEAADSNKYLLSPDPRDPMKYRLSVGARSIPVEVVPNKDMPTGTGNKIPFVIGALKEAIVFWDRQQRSIAESGVAAIGDLNAFEQDLTLWRAIEREDVTLRDTDAFVNGYIVPPTE